MDLGRKGGTLHSIENAVGRAQYACDRPGEVETIGERPVSHSDLKIPLNPPFSKGDFCDDAF